LLLPRARLPLNIFEPRYLAMTRDALGGGRLIGHDPAERPAPGRDEPAVLSDRLRPAASPPSPKPTTLRPLTESR